LAEFYEKTDGGLVWLMNCEPLDAVEGSLLVLIPDTTELGGPRRELIVATF